MKNKNIIIGIVLIILITIGAYLFESIAKNHGVNSATIVRITENNKVIAYTDADVLKKLVENNTQMDEEGITRGASLSLMVSAAGISNFKQIEVKGKEGSSVILSKKDVNGDFEIFIENGGSMNLCKKGSSSNFIVKQINEIIVEK